jgi:hypothetical protein
MLFSSRQIGGDISEQSWRAVTFGTHPSFSSALVGSPKRVYLGGSEVSRVNPDKPVSRLHCGAGSGPPHPDTEAYQQSCNWVNL